MAMFDGQVVVVTGGASGIGAATCRAFAAQGARVAVVDINGDGAADVAGGIGERRWRLPYSRTTTPSMSS
jgi:NAD(P)-dependent dehydrogenase (short-subunit alcohol dehydrogenase family)